jgi:hypothetical protein
MDINNSLIRKIDHIVKLSDEFDNIFTSLIKKKSEMDSKIIEDLYKLTQLFIFIRSEHGGIIMLMDRKKDDIKSHSSELSDKLVNELYDLSTFDSVMENVSNLISNIDFEFKRVAMMFPKYINKKPMTLILLTNNMNKNDKYITMINKIKEIHPENIYKVIQCEKGDKVNCGKISDKNINLTAKNIPALFLINEHKITELPSEQIDNVEILKNYFS